MVVNCKNGVSSYEVAQIPLMVCFCLSCSKPMLRRADVCWLLVRWGGIRNLKSSSARI